VRRWATQRPAVRQLAAGRGTHQALATLRLAARAPGQRGRRSMTCAPRQGAGQVIGMGDTGLDMGHCLLRDDAVPVPATLAGGLQQEPGGGALFFDSTAHRKLRYYRLADDGVDANGHGTHCGGSAAGSPQANGTGAPLRSRCSARAGPACLWHPAMRCAARPCMPALHSRGSAAPEPG